MSSSVKIIEDLKKIDKVGDKAAKALFNAGFTLEKVSVAYPNDIMKVLGCSMKASKLVVANAKQANQGLIQPPILATEYDETMDKLVQWIKFKNAPKVNELLGGGFKTSATAGLSGPQATGKTQFCFEMLLYVTNELLIPGTQENRDVIFIETELNTYSKRRLEEMARANAWDYKAEKILIAPARRIKDCGTQYYQYQQCHEIANANEMNPGLIIVDNLTALFQRKYSGRELLPNRKAELGRHLSYLEDMAKEWNALMICTLQVIECPVTAAEAHGGFSQATAKAMYGTNYIPWGGNVLKHTLGTWLSMEKTKKDYWRLVLFDSSELKSYATPFKIETCGIVDLIEKKLK